jgi:hypothetical protein
MSEIQRFIILFDQLAGDPAYFARVIQMQHRARHVRFPIGTRPQCVELRRLGADQQEAVHIPTMRVQELGVERLDRTLLLQATEILRDIGEILGAQFLSSGQR